MRISRTISEQYRQAPKFRLIALTTTHLARSMMLIFSYERSFEKIDLVPPEIAVEWVNYLRHNNTRTHLTQRYSPLINKYEHSFEQN
jgi:hypothetical protein